MVALTSLRSDVVRTITIRGRAEGIDQASTSLQRLAAAQGAVAIASEKTSVATVGMERRLATIQRRLDADWRNQADLARITRDLNLARSQGLITLDRHNQLLELAANRYGQAASAARTYLGTIRSLAAGFAGGVGSAIAFGAITSLPRIIGDVVDEASGLVDTADKIGITTKALQELHYAAGQTGVALGDLDQGLSFFSRQIGEASRGGGDLFEILKANNVALRDQVGRVRPLAALLGDYAELVANAGSSQERTLLVTKGLGRASDELVNTLSGGRAALSGFAADAERLGTVIDDRQLRQVEELADRWDAFVEGLSTRAKTAILAVVTGIDGLRQAVEDFKRALPGGGAGELGAETGSMLGNMNRATKVLREQLNMRGAGAPGSLVNVAFDERFAGTGPTVIPRTDTAGADKAANTLAKVNEALAFQTAQLGRTAREQEIYNQLNAAGVDINSAAGRKIADAAGALYDQREALAAVQERLDDTRTSMRDFLGTVVHGFMEGKKGAEAFGDALQGLASRIVDSGLDRLVDGLFGQQGSTKGGLIQMLLGGFGGGAVSSVGAGLYHAGGEVGSGRAALRFVHPGVFDHAPRLHGGLAPDEMPAILQKGERVIPRHLARATGGGDTITVTISSPIDARGAAPGMEKRLEAILDRRDERLRKELPRLIDDAKKKRLTKVV